MKNANLLVPIDFSELSFKALDAATLFAEIFDGAVTPFHSYIAVTGAGESGIEVSRKITEAHLELKQKLQEKLDQEVALHVDKSYLNPGIVQIGNPSESIVEEAQQFDMIVMTTHGRTGFTRLILGSVAEKVIRFAPVPVLVVEEASKIRPLEKILLTTDFSDYSLKALPFARTIAMATGAIIDLVHVVSFEQFGSIPQIQSAIDTRKKQLRDLVRNRFDDMQDQITCEVVPTKRSIHEKITRLAEKNNYNLIVMATIGRTGLEYLRLGSTASNVVRHVKSAVLTVNPRRLKGAKPY